MGENMYLTFDEEFRRFTAVVMNNWFALKVLTNNCSGPVNSINLKVKGLFDLLIASTQSVINNHCDWSESIEAIEDYFDSKFDTFVEDDSCEEVLHELVNYYNLLLVNKREDLRTAIAHLGDKRDFFTREEYNPDKIIRVAAHTPLSTQHAGSATVSEKEEGNSRSHSSSILGKRELFSDVNMKNSILPIQNLEAAPGNSEIISILESRKIPFKPVCNMRDESAIESGNEWQEVFSRRKRKNY